MRELVRAIDASHEASIRLALATAGIDANATTPTYAAAGRGPIGCVFSVDDADYDRATALLASLQQTSLIRSPERRSLKYLRWAFAALVAALVIYGIWRGPS
ncbi:MAG: hypothetical protein ABJE47_07630 [bacterium]